MTKYHFELLLLLGTVTPPLYSAQAPDPSTAASLRTPSTICRTLHSSKDFEELVTAMSNRVLEKLSAELSPAAFDKVDREKLKADIRKDLRKAAAGRK